MNNKLLSLALIGMLLAACSALHKGPQPVKTGTALDETAMKKWTSINTPREHWKWENGTLNTQANTIGYLRSPSSYSNYILSFDAFCEDGETGGVLVSSAALPETGSPYPDGIRIPVPSSQWRSYLVECTNGTVRIFSGRSLLQTISYKNRTEGFICLLANGRTSRFRNIKLTESGSGSIQKTAAPEMDTRFQALYNGVDLSDWELKPGHVGHWSSLNWTINYDGLSKERDKCLWTRKSYRNFEMIADVRLTRTPTPELTPVVLPNGDEALNADGSKKQVIELYAGDTGIYLRGHSKNQINIGYRYIGSGEIYGYRVDKNMPPAVREAVTPKIKADNFPGQWNRFFIRMVDDRLTVVLNGITVIDNAQLPGISPEGPIALQDDHASNNTFQFANLFIREL